jgi:hypothetical protein
MSAELKYDVHPYDMQRDGTALVSGFQVWAHVVMPTGKKTTPVAVALCSDKDTADEIAELLNAKYNNA